MHIWIPCGHHGHCQSELVYSLPRAFCCSWEFWEGSVPRGAVLQPSLPCAGAVALRGACFLPLRNTHPLNSPTSPRNITPAAACLSDDVPKEEKLPRFPACLVCNKKAEYYIRWAACLARFVLGRGQAESSDGGSPWQQFP